MGSCISKCKPKKPKHNVKEEAQDHMDQNHQKFGLNSNVQDKLVIVSQIPKATTQTILFSSQLLPNKPKTISPSKTPPSPSHSNYSSSSASSFVTCTASKASTSSSSSLSSSASSALGSKDKPSFSNEYLRSCYEENPHITRINSLKDKTNNCSQKRVRSSSPINNPANLTRQKSFRRDQYCSRDSYYRSSTMRSPSPSRRLGSNIHGEKSPMIGPYYHANPRPCSLNNSNSSRSTKPCSRNGARSREQRNVHRISSKIDEIAAAQALSCHEIDSILMEDNIDNPLISLDCFIFI